MCPGTRKSNGKVLSRKTKHSGYRAAAAFRIAAASLVVVRPLSVPFYRRIRVRVGPAEAVTATARKLAVLYYSLLKHGSSYVEIGQTVYEQKYQQRRLNSIQKQALAMGYQLIPAA